MIKLFKKLKKFPEIYEDSYTGCWHSEITSGIAIWSFEAVGYYVLRINMDGELIEIKRTTTAGYHPSRNEIIGILYEAINKIETFDKKEIITNKINDLQKQLQELKEVE